MLLKSCMQTYLFNANTVGGGLNISARLHSSKQRRKYCVNKSKKEK